MSSASDANDRNGQGLSTHERLLWDRDGNDWPNRSASRFVAAGGLTWHVQQMGQGPCLLLIHGTGAATHSWRDIMPILARDFTVVSLDLPGHGFTDLPDAAMLSLPGMSGLVAQLLQELQVAPAYAVGHSAGAAILCHMNLAGSLHLKALVSLNGALRSLSGLLGVLVPPLARMLAKAPFLPDFFVNRARSTETVRRLLDGTGSKIDARGVELYARALRTRQHIAAALGMMGHWDLATLHRDLPRLQPFMLLIAGSQDLTISAEQSFEVREIVARSRVELVRGLGHLAHEEQPERIAELIVRCKEACEREGAAS